MRTYGANTLIVVGLAAVCTLLCAGCRTEDSRSWVDDRTAVSVTAQAEPLILAREDFAAGVNVRDYAELGLVELNRSGNRQPCLAVILWSTVNRTAEDLARQEAGFARITLWANDQPLRLTHSSVADQALSIPAFSLPSPGAREFLYELSDAQLGALAEARQLSLRTDNSAQDEQAFTLWRGSLDAMRSFAMRLQRSASRE